MFQDTRPAELDASGHSDAWAEFRVSHPQERLALLRELRDGSAPIILNAPCGSTLAVALWAVDSAQERLNFSLDAQAPRLAQVVDADEAVAVAYLQSVKLQFDVHGFTLVRGAHSMALQCAMPREIYRFQRRSAFRVRPQERLSPTVHLRHPALPDMQLALRVVDVSIGGCALWLPEDVPALQPGTRIGSVQVELDAETRFSAALQIAHVSSLGSTGQRLGCEWVGLPGTAERVLQRWIDRSQQRRRLLTLE